MSKGNPRSFARQISIKQTRRVIRPIQLIIGLIFCAIIIGLAWWFRHNFEQVTSTDYVLKTEAQYNPYYAAELLINSQHNNDDADDTVAITLLDSDLKTLLDELPPIDKTALADGKRPTLIINSIGTKLTDERFDALKSWIEQGGYLITFAARDSSYDDMQAALERLHMLEGERADPETINNDETLNELLAALDSGNEFLNELGIFRADTNYDLDNLIHTEDNAGHTDDSEVAKDSFNGQIEQIIAEAEQQINAKSLSVEEEIAELTRLQPLSLIDVSSYNTDLLQQQLLMVEIWHSQSKLDAQLFQALYPDTAQINLQQTATDDTQILKQQAQRIRQYINTSQTNNNTLNAESADKDIKNSDLKDDKKQRLSKLLTTMLALSDEQLVALFYPTNSVYLQASFGKGRLSVINDSDVFSNPNPNLELTNKASIDVDTSDAIKMNSAPSSALYKLLNSDQFSPTSLLTADNAAWLIALTQNSSEVWILPNTDIDSLPVMLWKQTRPALLGLGLLGLLWLWSLYNRFGKMAHLPSNQSRDIMRYFRQVGRFGWHQDKAQRLTQATTDKVRLLVNEHLKSTVTTSSLTDVPATSHLTALNAVTNHEQPLSIAKLHELLTNRLADKKRLLLRSISTNDRASYENQDSLLLNNEAFIQETISTERLRHAFDSSWQDNAQAFKFTQMTQTLWMIQWLLK